jgi:hypothetical protein
MTSLQTAEFFVSKYPHIIKLFPKNYQDCIQFTLTLTQNSHTFAYLRYKNPTNGFFECEITVEKNLRIPPEITEAWVGLLDLHRELTLQYNT